METMAADAVAQAALSPGDALRNRGRSDALAQHVTAPTCCFRTDPQTHISSRTQAQLNTKPIVKVIIVSEIFATANLITFE